MEVQQHIIDESGLYNFRFLLEAALENFRPSYLKLCAKIYDERRADNSIKAIRSEEVNLKRIRRKFWSGAEAKPKIKE
jgi:hypothetical protein